MRNDQHGMTIIEVMVVLVISIIGLSIGMGYVQKESDRSAALAAGGHAQQVGDAASAYIKDNYSTVVAGSTPTTPLSITVAMLKPQYLPASFSSTNGYGQTYSVLALQPAPNKIEALVVTTGGSELPEVEGRRAAQNIGAAGGFISVVAPAVVTGAYGGWSITLPGSYGVNPGAGHLAIALFFQDGSLVSDYLYRNPVPGRPELNQMNTPLIMGSTQTVGGVCATTGAMARDSGGAIISCQSGIWKSMGDGKCVATSADLNILHNDGRCYNGVGNANSPAGVDWFFLEVYRHVNEANFYTVQRVMGMTGASIGKVWHRNQQSNTSGTGWSAWEQQADNKVSIWSQPAEGGVVTITANDGNKMHIQTVNGGRLRLVNSPWNTELASFDQSGNLTLNQDGATNVGYINPGWAVETWGCSANGSIAKSAYNIIDGWAWNGKTLTCQNGVWGSALTASTLTLGTVVTENTGCSPNGKVARDAAGLLLSCQSGVWKKAGGRPVTRHLFTDQLSGSGYIFSPSCASNEVLTGCSGHRTWSSPQVNFCACWLPADQGYRSCAAFCTSLQ